MYKWLRLLLVIGVIISLQAFIDKDDFVSARTIELSNDMYGENKSVNEKGIIKNLSSEDITLKGLVDGVEMYYEVPVEGVKKGSYLQLNLQYSRLLLNHSTITVLIDDIPVESVELDVQSSNMRVKVPLEGQAVSQGFHNVSISFYGHISEHHCTNEENPANWLTILSDSHLFLNVNETSEQNFALQNYPYPFIQNYRDQPVQSTIVIPNEASPSIVMAALKVANALSEQAGGNVEVPIVLESDLQTISTHIIAIGKEKDWSAIVKDLYASADIQLPKNELVISNYFLKFPQGIKQALFVTAQNDETIAEKIAVLTESHIVAQLEGAEVSINKFTTEKHEVKQFQTFQEMNIPNLTLTGTNEMSSHYFFELPSYVDVNKPMTLNFNLKVSDTLFTREDLLRDKPAELVVYVNEEPYSIAIDDLEKNDLTSSYEVALSIEAEVLQKSSFVMLQFEANGLKRREICVPPDDDQWIFISENSHLQWSIVDEDREANSRSWPAPFISTAQNSETTILMPNQYNKHLLNQLQMITNRLGNARTLEGLQLMFSDNVDEKKLKNRHVIVIGNPYDYTELTNDTEQLLIPLVGNHLDLSAFRFINETAKHVVWLQRSLWDDKRSMAVFSAVHPDEIKSFLSEEIVEYLRTTGVEATVVVESKNGEIFTNAQMLSEKSSKESAIDEQHFSMKNGWFIAGILGMVVVIVILLIYVIRKKD